MVAIPRVLMLWVLFGVTFDEAAAERTARVDADRNCCLADLLAAGRASLRRKTLPTELMVMVEFCKIKVRLEVADCRLPIADCR